MKRIDVAVGVVYNAQGQVLVGQRVVQDLYFRKWEFPGGKVEAAETVEAALKREFLEEVGIHIGKSNHLMLVEHDYPDRHVRLHVHVIREFQGQVQALEGQELRWVDLEHVHTLDFLQGNQSILDRLIALDQR